MSKASSSAMTSSTRSRLSASRSSPNLASRVTCSGETCSTSTAHFLNVSKLSSAMVGILRSCWLREKGQDFLVPHAEAAVDRQHGPGHVGGAGRGEEGDRGGD